MKVGKLMVAVSKLTVFCLTTGILICTQVNADDGALARDKDALDIVPMPKHIKLMGDETVLSPVNAVLVLGAEPARQSLIGAEWINKRLRDLGAADLPVLTHADIPADKLAVIIGTPADNPLIVAAVEAGIVKVGEKNPGERGYEIRTAADANRIFLAGADDIGTLYACVTFGELLMKRDGATDNGGTADNSGTATAVWRRAEVRDWPDIIHVSMGDDMVGGTSIPELAELYVGMRNNDNPTPEQREQYLAAFREHYDRLLRWKVTLLCYHTYLRGQPFRHRAGYDIIREGIEYGKERGIGALLYAEHPFVGLRDRYPDLADQALPPGRYPQWIRSWGMDEVRRQTASELAAHLASLGITDIGFHDTDTGGLDNPAQWNERPAADRERWDDDYVAATVHKHMIYYDELKKAAPDIRLHFTIYPYNIQVLDPDSGLAHVESRYGRTAAAVALAERYRETYTEFWRRLHGELPPDITFCIRETGLKPVRAFQELVPGRGTLVWYAVQSHAWWTFFGERSRCIGMFYNDPHDLIFTRYSDQFVPFNSLATREYSWNINTPGAIAFDDPSLVPAWSRAPRTNALYTLVAPRICRAIFGERAGDAIARAVTLNLDARQIFDGLRSPTLRQLQTSVDWDWQAGLAEAGAAQLDELWEQCRSENSRLGMDDYAFRRFVNLREVFHTARWMARARYYNILARELAMTQDTAGAETAIARGLHVLDEADAGVAMLLAQRPEDPVLDARDHHRHGGRIWRAYIGKMADMADFAPARAMLQQTRTELMELGSLGAVPADVLEKLASERIVRATITDNANIQLDGILDEAIWAAASPVETFFVLAQGQQVARAHTRARLLADDADRMLYLGIEAWMPGDAAVNDDDCVEVFLRAPGTDSDYVHFFLHPDGRVRHQRCRQITHDGESIRWQQDNDWRCAGLESAVTRKPGRWSMEIAIPIDGLEYEDLPESWRQGNWTLNLARIARMGDENELSSILPPGRDSFHDTTAFHPIRWIAADKTVLDVGIQADELKVEVQTLPDAIASVAEFMLAVNSPRVLHDVVITAEAYDAAGKLHRRQELTRVDRIFYAWQAPHKFDVAFQQECPAGGIRLILQSAEGTVEHWLRFGGWEGSLESSDLSGISIFAPDGKGGMALSAPCFFPECDPA